MGRRQEKYFFVGYNEAKQRWVEDILETWEAGVKHLAEFSREFPHTDYAGSKISLQQEWNVFQCVTPSVGTLFAPM